MSLFQDDDADVQGAAHAHPPAEVGLAPPRAARGLVGHNAARARLLDMVRGGRLPGGLILAGPRGVGKATTAFALARLLLSGAAPDTLDCPPGHPVAARVAAGGEPDLLTAEPAEGKATLGVEAVRAIAHFAHLTPARAGGWRVAIVDDACAMTRQAQNALLKVLEEPPARALLILIAHRPGLLLPTVRSRAARLTFGPLEAGEVAALLAQSADPPPEADRALLAALAGGSAGAALAQHAAGAAEIWARLGPLLNAPDWPAAHALAETLGARGPEAEAAYGAFADLMLWRARQACRAAPGEAGPLGVHDALADHLRAARAAALDRRSAVLCALMIWHESG
jgi:DNA polymerase III subunit delta'